jgi:hypothetical protein
LTVGALTSGATGQSGGALDKYCSLSGAPSDACSDFSARSPHCSLLQTTVGVGDRCSAWHTGQSGATPDSPVNYSGEASQKPEGGKFRVDLLGAPDSPARPGQPPVVFCSFLLNRFLDFILVCVEPLAPVELII